MNEPQNRKISISDEQMAGAIAAGIQFLNLKSTLIPGDMKKQLSVLEVVLSGISKGALQVVPTPPPAVESTSETGNLAGSSAVKRATKGNRRKK